jgi:predicted lipoprotein with Yx(FWY)xxD motif
VLRAVRQRLAPARREQALGRYRAEGLAAGHDQAQGRPPPGHLWGHPLYFFAQDKRAGDVNGQGVVHLGGAWWVVSAGGTKITKTAG